MVLDDARWCESVAKLILRRDARPGSHYGQAYVYIVGRIYPVSEQPIEQQDGPILSLKPSATDTRNSRIYTVPSARHVIREW